MSPFPQYPQPAQRHAATRWPGLLVLLGLVASALVQAQVAGRQASPAASSAEPGSTPSATDAPPHEAGVPGRQATDTSTGPGTQAPDAARRAVQQKLMLAERMVEDPGFVQRVRASADAQAQAQLGEAQIHLAAARDALAREDLAAARKSADDALRHVGLARRLAPDAPGRQAAARQRQEQLQASVERLLNAWRVRVQALARERAAEGGPAGGSAAAPDLAAQATGLAAADGLLANAIHLAGEKRHDEASALLRQAERHVLEGMNRLLTQTTLDYSLRPSNPTEELEQELARQRGLAELLPLALADLKPRPEAQAQAERYADTATTLRAQALQQQQAGDLAQALSLARNATLYVQRALQATGLVVPQAPGDNR